MKIKRLYSSNISRTAHLGSLQMCLKQKADPSGLRCGTESKLEVPRWVQAALPALRLPAGAAAGRRALSWVLSGASLQTLVQAV